MGINANEFKDIDPGERILMGPGPSNVHPRVMQAMSAPCVGHLDPYYLSVMDEVKVLLRFLFQTRNEMTISVSGTGTAGMEACLANIIEPGDEVVICVNGVFSARMCDIANRLGGKVTSVEGEWGRAMDQEKVRKAVKGKGPKLVAAVHAETSTGACQPVVDLAEIAHECGALFLADMVTSLGGMDVALDRMGIDIAYSGTQKCISCPPGLAPVSFNERSMEVIRKRKKPVVSLYLDMGLLKTYWDNDGRAYHHTGPINMNYALREALRLIAEEGLEPRFARHLLNHRALVAGVEAMGLSMLVPEGERLPTLNTIRIPDGADDAKVRRALLEDFGIEIGGGLGELAGKIWRVGLMGHTSSRRNVTLFLGALETVLKAEGVNVRPGALEAASEIYGEAS
ncbi:MAG: alanine--glyoxylate aminotransferase family protein [Deltaproteobacteria bacterium]|nr:alanine--glyoxylate aminotransferase family protein [Deltaproteobacteria bacterium]MBW2137684.1 alanine--glyoxylate aminotransferase family protein [Deltaproteobacteria bacterium]